MDRLFELIDARLAERMAVVCDVGLAMFGSIDLTISGKTEFLAPAYYCSMGFAIPGSIGLALANRELRPVVLVGDGAFHMTGNEMGTIARLGLDPIVIVLDNAGYTTERFIHDGAYNDLHPWRFEALPQLLGTGWGVRVATELEFAQAWEQAVAHRGSFSVISCKLGPYDGVSALKRLGEQLGNNVKDRGQDKAAVALADHRARRRR